MDGLLITCGQNHQSVSCGVECAIGTCGEPPSFRLAAWYLARSDDRLPGATAERLFLVSAGLFAASNGVEVPLLNATIDRDRTGDLLSAIQADGRG
jgi:hypothetical protein